MEYRKMGRTGLRVSTICLGTMTFGFQTDQAAALRIMDTAWEAGVNFLDTSDVYPMGSEAVGTTEEIVGSWLKRMPRDRVVVATKSAGRDRRRRERQRALPPAHPERGRRQPRAAGHGLHRPLPDALPRSEYADRGDAGRA